MKAATICTGVIISTSSISIHAAREGGDAGYEGLYLVSDISIHAAREGGDAEEHDYRKMQEISIHAAREGGDPASSSICEGGNNFNPRRP